MKTQKLYIITGLPYAGKTTLTRKLKEKFKLDTTSLDNYIDQGNYQFEHMALRDWSTVYENAFKELEEFLRAGKGVVFDGGSLKKSERDALRDLAVKTNTRYLLIYVSTPPDENKSRWVENQKTLARAHLPEVVMNMALAMFEEPTADEHPVIYSSATNFDAWAKENDIA